MQLMITDLEDNMFPDIMQKNVLNPLGMTSSTFVNPLPEEYHSIAATGYRENGDEVEGKWPIYPEMAAAGLWTTPSQLILWAQEIQKIQQTQKDGLLKTQTVNEMLTAGMNEYGIGPAVHEHTYGHGGADKGFRARLTAWKEHPVAVVVMVNSDNGSIIQEILLSLAKEYDLPGIDPMVRKVVAQSEEVRTKFVGTYTFPQMGEAYVVLKENGLEIDGEFTDEPIMLLPETDTQYFNKSSGTYYTFHMEEGTVTGIQLWDRIAEKTK